MITILEPQTLRFNDMRYFIIDEIQLKDNKKWFIELRCTVERQGETSQLKEEWPTDYKIFINDVEYNTNRIDCLSSF